MKNIKKSLIIYKECIKISLSSAAAYRIDFILSMVISLVGNILFPLVTVLIYSSGAGFAGWGIYEVLLIQSLFIISGGLETITMGSVIWKTLNHIREGSFETVLLKPMDPLFFLILSAFDPGGLGQLIGGFVIFGIAASHTGIVSFAAFMKFLMLFAAGFAVTTGISMIMAATSFKWVGNSRIPEIFDSIKTFGMYPASIFPSAVKGIVAFIVPVGMIGFFPASALLGRMDPLNMLAVIPCVLFMFIGIWIYHYMIRMYESVGG